MIEIKHHTDGKNSIDDIVSEIESNDVIEVYVNFNTSQEIIICHQQSNTNGDSTLLLETLLSITERNLNIMIDIKGRGIKYAIELATQVFHLVCKYSQHTYKLCSFNEYCIAELIELRVLYEPIYVEIGVKSSGVPLGGFEHLSEIDFVCLKYEFIDNDIVEKIKFNNKKIYTWISSLDLVCKYSLQNVYKLDGIIFK